MSKTTQLTDSVLRLKSSMEQEGYKGKDPYDGLLSPIFSLPVLRSNHTLRFLSQQAIKRSPFDLRPILFVPKGQNPVTLGLVIHAHVHLKRAGILQDFNHTNILIEQLVELRSKGYPYSCWGYDFPWSAKHAEIPSFGPTVVATGIITNALFLYWKETACTLSAKMITEACEFVTHALNRSTTPSGGLIFSYSPFDHEAVLNASMKAVRLLSQGFVVRKDKSHLDLAKQGLGAILNAQRPDGSWPYSLRSKGQWTDNYHTGYVLDGIDEYIKNTGDESPKSTLTRGLDFYLSHFIGDDGRPHLYSNRPGPADCTAAGQTLLTLTRFGKIQTAQKVASWMLKNMQSKSGHFFYRRHRWFTQKTGFMRWSDSWMLAGLSSLLDAESRKEGVE